MAFVGVRPFKEFRDSGLLWLFNTTALHPRGYALGLVWGEGANPEFDEPIGWTLLGDGLEPFVFGEDIGRFDAVERLLNEQRKHSEPGLHIDAGGRLP